VLAVHPDAKRLPAEDRTRLAIPADASGLQEIVVDLEYGQPTTTGVRLRATGFGKEGLLTSSYTRNITDQVWAAATSPDR
jgi:hypothetical protein